MPALMRHEMPNKMAKLAQLGRRVFGVTEKDDAKAAEAGIAKMEQFFRSIAMKTRLADYGISSQEAAQKVSERFRSRGAKFGERQSINASAAREILLAC